MPKAIYVNISEINGLQTDIMIFVGEWVRKKKTPVPLKDIIAEMEIQDNKNYTTIKAINVLLKKGYIRRAYTISNKTFFVQLKSV